MRKSNAELEEMALSLAQHLDRTDRLGFAAARNTRLIRDALIDYRGKRDELVRKYGEAGDDGNVSISPASNKWAQFVEELAPLSEIEIDVDVFTVDEDDLVGKITGSQVLEIDWMLAG